MNVDLFRRHDLEHVRPFAPKVYVRWVNSMQKFCSSDYLHVVSTVDSCDQILVFLNSHAEQDSTESCVALVWLPCVGRLLVVLRAQPMSCEASKQS
jgi:hypothetical protein